MSETDEKTQDQPNPETAPRPAPPVVELTDEEAARLLEPLAFALLHANLYEGSTAPRGAAFERLTGPLALGTAARLLTMMRGQPLPQDTDLAFTLRQMLRSMPLSAADQHRLMQLRPGLEFQAQVGVVGEDGKTREAEVVVAARRNGVIQVGAAKFPDNPTIRGKLQR